MTKKTESMPQIEEITKELSQDTRDSNEALIFINAIEITNGTGVKDAVKIIADFKERADYLDGKRKTWVDPLNAVIRDINATFKPILDAYESCENALKNKIAGYHNAQAQKRSDLISEAGSSPNAEELLKAADQCLPEKIPGLAIKQSWDGEIVDPDRIVKWCIENNRLELLTPDLKALKALTKAKSLDPRIDGWKAYPKSTVAITASKIEK